MTDIGSGHANRILRLDRTVADLDTTAAFYCSALGFEEAGRHDDWVRLRLGDQELRLTDFAGAAVPYPNDSTAADLWFQHVAIVTPDMRAAYARLQDHIHQPITTSGPVTLPAQAGGVTAYKFRDPDGHPLELIQFPSGTGDPIWRNRPADALTIGIDHSAISVSDSGTSISFYRDVLGFAVSARQINKGPEQERLDALTDDHVEVIALAPAAAHPPHLELLCYRTPKGRSDRVPPTSGNIAADRLVLEVRGLDAILAQLNQGRGLEPVEAQGNSALVSDPDGHLLLLVEEA